MNARSSISMSDSFESIIDDSQLIPCDYSRKRGAEPINAIRCRGCMFVGLGACDKKMKQDLVRRCEDVSLHNIEKVCFGD